MARYTTAYTSLAGRIAEAEILRQFAAKKEKENPVILRYEINALCRGSMVLLCGHLEAFIKQLGEVALDRLCTQKVPRAKISSRIYYHISKDILDELKYTIDIDKITDKIFTFIESDLPYWSRKGPFPQSITTERFNKGFSNPGYKKIQSYFGRFGYSGYNHDLAKFLKAKFIPITNMVDHLVDTRNKIAHGDPGVTKTPSEVKEMIKMIRNYCMATDNVFATWCGKTICKIK